MMREVWQAAAVLLVVYSWAAIIHWTWPVVQTVVGW
jgi:hypothetical protein